MGPGAAPPNLHHCGSATMEKAVILAPEGQRTRPLYHLRRGWSALVRRQELIVVLLLLLVGTALSLGTQTFFTGTNLLNVAIYVSWFAIAAFGVSMVMIVGGIDLSVGSTMALAGLVSALALQEGMPLLLAIALGVLSGGAVGLINGALVGRFRLPPFMVTLGTLSVARGITIGLSSGAPVRDLPASFQFIGQGNLGLGAWPLPLPVLWMLLLAVWASLFGGEGTVTGVVLGAALMQTVRNGLVLLGVPSHWQVVTIGAMILLVMLLDHWRRRRVWR